MKIRVILFLLIILSIIAVLFSKTWMHRPTVAENRRTNCERLFGRFVQKLDWQHNPCFFIAHATGSIDGFVYTNSHEALQKSIADGYRLIEIDLQETSDGHLVGAHTWEEFKQAAGFPPEKIDKMPLSLEEFKKHKIHGRLTPLTADDIEAIFSANTSLVLVTDKSNNWTLIKKSFSFQNRLIVEVFGQDAFLTARQIGIQNPALKISDTSDLRFIKKNHGQFVTAHLDTVQRFKKEFSDLLDSNVNVFSYTSDDRKVFDTHLGNTTTAFYTDRWDLKTGSAPAP